MRVFKFRAWHEGHKGKYEPSMLFEHRPGDVFLWLREGQPLHIMQFSGELDCKGNEIYEGDIVKVRDDWDEFGMMSGEIREVYFLDGGFRLKPKGMMKSIPRGHWLEDGSDVEVIGNIYQNPELLNS